MTDEYEGRIFDHILFPIRGANGQVRRLAVISADVTERKQVERIRQEAFDRIEQNIEQFAILADHVRQPLQVILGMTELLDEGTATERIREQVERINAIVSQLDRGWIESRKIREFLRRHETA
jgi:signal transduction histidine kinase